MDGSRRRTAPTAAAEASISTHGGRGRGQRQQSFASRHGVLVVAACCCVVLAELGFVAWWTGFLPRMANDLSTLHTGEIGEEHLAPQQAVAAETVAWRPPPPLPQQAQPPPEPLDAWPQPRQVPPTPVEEALPDAWPALPVVQERPHLGVQGPAGAEDTPELPSPQPPAHLSHPPAAPVADECFAAGSSPWPAFRACGVASFNATTNKEDYHDEELRIAELQASSQFTTDRVARTVGRLRHDNVAPSVLRFPGVPQVMQQATVVEAERTGQPWLLTRKDVLYAHMIRCYSFAPDTAPTWFTFQSERTKGTYRGWQAACARFWQAEDPGDRLRSLREDLIRRTVAGRAMPSALLYNGGFIHYGMNGVGLAGDPLQWTDLLNALLVMGVEVLLATDTAADRSITQALLGSVPVVYTDYLGLDSLPVLKLPGVACKLRVLDAYGTTQAHNMGSSPHLSPPFCCAGLDLAQFLTFVPGRSPANTFLGMVVTQYLPYKLLGDPGFERQYAGRPNLRRREEGAPHVEPIKPKIKVSWVVVDQPDGMRLKRPQRQWLGLIVGKLGKYFDAPGVAEFLGNLAAHIPLVATVGPNKKFVPPFVANVGVLKQSSYALLVQTAAIAIGIGEPYLSNGLIEACASGSMVLNIHFGAPRRLEGKPTDQELDSQHPEVSGLPEPIAFTLPLDAGPELIKSVMAKALRAFQETQPFGHRFMPPGHAMPDFMATVLGTVAGDDFCPKKQQV